MKSFLFSIATLCFFMVFNISELMAQNTGPYYTAFPDADGDGFKDPLVAGQTYDINSYTFTFPGNIAIRQTGDSITFLAVFLATGCNAFCADQSLPFYHNDGQMFGIMGADRAYKGWVIFPQPGEYLLVGSTRNGYAIRETVPVTNCPTGGGNLTLTTDTLIIQFSLSGTTGTNMIENLQEKIYPNPVNDVLIFKDLPSDVVVKVFNVAGQQVFITEQNPTQIQMGDFVSGIYFVKAFKDGVQFMNAKIIKQ